MPTAIFTIVAENFCQITCHFGDFDELMKNLEGTPLLIMPGAGTPSPKSDLVPLHRAYVPIHFPTRSPHNQLR